MLALKVGPVWIVSSWDKKTPHLRALSASQLQRLHFPGLFSARGCQLSPLESITGFLSKPWLLEPGDAAFCLVSLFFKVSLKVLCLQKKCELLTGQKLGARSAEGVYKLKGWFSTAPAAVVQLFGCL